MTVPSYLIGQYYNVYNAPQAEGETEKEFVERVITNLKAGGKFIEANELIAGHRWDSDEADGTVEKLTLLDTIKANPDLPESIKNKLLGGAE